MRGTRGLSIWAQSSLFWGGNHALVHARPFYMPYPAAGRRSWRAAHCVLHWCFCAQVTDPPFPHLSSSQSYSGKYADVPFVSESVYLQVDASA